jgi:hypothetical protein
MNGGQGLLGERRPAVERLSERQVPPFFPEGGEEQAARGLLLASLSFSLSRAIPRPVNTLSLSSFFLAFLVLIPGSGCKVVCLGITNS